MMQSSAVAAVFNAAFAAQGTSPTLTRIFSDAFGEESPPPEAATFSYVTRSDLEAAAGELQVGPGQRFVDLGCGSGGPTLWVARRTGASALGLDISSVAIERAQQRARELGLEQQADFAVGAFLQTGQCDASFDAVMSLDSLWLAEDLDAAAREVARLLRPGGRLFLTSWETALNMPGCAPQTDDYAELLGRAGLQIVARRVSTGWQERQRAVYAGALAQESQLVAELGPASQLLLTEARMATGLLDGTDYLAPARRVVVVARRD